MQLKTVVEFKTPKNETIAISYIHATNICTVTIGKVTATSTMQKGKTSVNRSCAIEIQKHEIVIKFYHEFEFCELVGFGQVQTSRTQFEYNKV